ncbi:MAG: hypothetical protein U0263_31425 [Polyangiaceae bacterium]
MHIDIAQAEKWRRWRAAMLFVVAAISWHLTFEGLHTLKGFWTSVELATITTIFHTFSWMLLYDAVPKAAAGLLPPGRSRYLAFVGVVAAVGIIFTATFYSWVGIAAAPSQRKHMRDTTGAATTTLADLRESRQRAQDLRPVLSQTSESILKLAQDEEKHGALSTKNNKGPFTLALYALSSAYDDAASIMEKDDAIAAENFAEAERLLTTMRALDAEASTHDDRVEDVNSRFAEAAQRLNRLLSDLKKGPLRSALAVVRKSDATIQFLPARRDSPSETAAKAALIKLASDSKTRIDQLAEGSDQTLITVPRFEPMSREEAAIAYVRDFPQYVGYCLVFDLAFPLVGLIAALIFSPYRSASDSSSRADQGGKRSRSREDDGGGDLPAEHANRERILQALRSASLRTSAVTHGDARPLSRKVNGTSDRNTSSGGPS